MGGVTVTDELADSTNVLVLGGAERSSPAPPSLPKAGEKLLLITFGEPPDDLLSELGYQNDTSETRVVAVGDGVRSAAAASAGPVTTIEHPADLTELGIRVGRTLDAWPGSEVVVEFHTLTELLEHCDVERAFRFLHVLTGQLSRADATARFYLDPEQPDASTMATLRPLFDNVLREEDGEWVLA